VPLRMPDSELVKCRRLHRNRAQSVQLAAPCPCDGVATVHWHLTSMCWGRRVTVTVSQATITFTGALVMHPADTRHGHAQGSHCIPCGMLLAARRLLGPGGASCTIARLDRAR
jgi:hypothetical protein